MLSTYFPYSWTMTVIVTGAAGYIGSHIVSALLELGEKVVGIDDLSTGRAEFLNPQMDFRKADISNFDELYPSLISEKGTQNLSVIHAAGIKFAGESVHRPLDFYNTNFSGTLNVLKVMEGIGAENLVFSSSCSVYGNIQDGVGVRENSPLIPVSPYGRSKYFAELAINDFASTGRIKAVSLRYFNVAGNGKSQGFDISPYNLFPNIYRAIENKTPIQIFGNSFKTTDGSCVRDYVDVSLLAQAHITTLNHLREDHKLEPAYNLGSGYGASVLEIVDGAKKYIDANLEHLVTGARTGDPGSILADVSSAIKDLGWNHTTPIHQMLVNGWKAWKELS
jgi:UDP-glucose 4-epimerase